MIRLLLIDDEPIVLRFLEHCFSDATRYCIVESLSCASLAQSACERWRPDAVFLDIRTKECHTNGLLTAQKLKKEFPEIKVLLMTGCDEISFEQRARRAGVDAFLNKNLQAQEFVRVLDRVLSGESVFPERGPKVPVQEGELPLTERELEVLRLVCKDYSNREMAHALSITESTVKRHMENLFRKTGTCGRPGLIAFAISGGWIDPNI
ncbi:hypothetical protein ABB02_01594 [Clostridiaceae bacterium JG1575]|nr:hypothetical protein ABB02_01594 [Clostridiaceae bacterium JG1575]